MDSSSGTCFGTCFDHEEPKSQLVLVNSCEDTLPECFKNGSRARYHGKT